MQKIIRKRPPAHLVVTDTNILWHGDKSKVVNPEFENFWTANLNLIEMQLIIPQVVKGELLFQHTTSAIKAFNKSKENIVLLNAITEGQFKNRISEEKIRKRVEDRFEQWFKSKGAVIHPTPVSNINWETLIEASIWRQAPFSMDPDNESEKGFRDALILETVLDVCKSHEKQVAFVCNDSLLRETANTKRTANPNLAVYESLPQFASYIKLTQEELTGAFVKSILERAREKFYSRNDSECLYQRGSVVGKIREQFESEFKIFDAAGSTLLTGQLFPGEAWKPSNEEKRWISGTQFESLKGDREFHWSTRVSFVQLFKNESTSSLVASLLLGQEKLRVLEFKVLWKANIKADARFHDCTVENIEFSGRRFDAPTNEDVQRFGLAKMNAANSGT